MRNYLHIIISFILGLIFIAAYGYIIGALIALALGVIFELLQKYSVMLPGQFDIKDIYRDAIGVVASIVFYLIFPSVLDCVNSKYLSDVFTCIF